MNKMNILYRLSCIVALTSCGCVNGSLFSGYNVPAIPANRVPAEFLGRSREAMQDVSISRLRQAPPETYQLAAGDVLGIYIENVLGDAEGLPPVHFPEAGDQAPAIGFPIPVRDDGTLALPLVDPVVVEGLTLEQATQKVSDVYTTGNQILKPGKDRVIVTLMRRRQVRILVIREEAGGQEGVLKRGSGEIVDLNAYENDVLHALNETGGLPGLDAKNEILIIRGGSTSGADYDRFVAAVKSCKGQCECPPSVGDSPDVTRIPIRFYPEDVPDFTEEDIILQTGDIVYIKSRESEKYYTGGVLGGGEHIIPRDYDLNVLKAVSIAGGSVGSGSIGISSMGGGGGGGRGGGGGGGRGGGTIGPSRLIVLRKSECGDEIPIKIDMNRALTDPSQRILVMPGDTLIMQYTIKEEIFNVIISMFSFNYLLNSGR